METNTVSEKAITENTSSEVYISYEEIDSPKPGRFRKNPRVSGMLVAVLFSGSIYLLDLQNRIGSMTSDALAWVDLGKKPKADAAFKNGLPPKRGKEKELSGFDEKVARTLGMLPASPPPAHISYRDIGIEDHDRTYREPERVFSTFSWAVNVSPVESGGGTYYSIEDVDGFLEMVLAHTDKLSGTEVGMIGYAKEFFGASTISVVDLFTLMKGDRLSITDYDIGSAYDTLQIRYQQGKPVLVLLNNSDEELVIQESPLVIEALFVTFQATVMQMIAVDGGMTLADYYHTFMKGETYVFDYRGVQKKWDELSDHDKSIWYAFLLLKLSSEQQQSRLFSHNILSMPDLPTLVDLFFTLGEGFMLYENMPLVTGNGLYVPNDLADGRPQRFTLAGEADKNSLGYLAGKADGEVPGGGSAYKGISNPDNKPAKLVVLQKDHASIVRYMNELKEDTDRYLKVVIGYYMKYGVWCSDMELMNYMLFSIEHEFNNPNNRITDEERYSDANYDKVIKQLLDDENYEHVFQKLDGVIRVLLTIPDKFPDGHSISWRFRQNYQHITGSESVIGPQAITQQVVTNFLLLYLKKKMPAYRSGDDSLVSVESILDGFTLFIFSKEDT